MFCLWLIGEGFSISIGTFWFFYIRWVGVGMRSIFDRMGVCAGFFFFWVVLFPVIYMRFRADTRAAFKRERKFLRFYSRRVKEGVPDQKIFFQALDLIQSMTDTLLMPVIIFRILPASASEIS